MLSSMMRCDCFEACSAKRRHSALTPTPEALFLCNLFYSHYSVFAFDGLERLRHSTPTVPLNLIRIFLRCPVDRSDLAFQSLLRIGDARDTERNYPRHSDASDSH